MISFYNLYKHAKEDLIICKQDEIVCSSQYYYQLFSWKLYVCKTLFENVLIINRMYVDRHYFTDIIYKL